MSELRYEVVWPLSRRAQGEAGVAQPLSTLNDKTVAFLWNYAFRGDLMYEVVRHELRERFPGVRFVDHEVFENFHGGTDEREVMACIPGRLRDHRANAAIIGVGA